MTINTNAPLQFTTLDGSRTVPVTFSHMTKNGRFAVDVAGTDDSNDFDNGPYLFDADGSHYKGNYGPLTNADPVSGETFTVNGTPVATFGAALILAGSLVNDGTKVEVLKTTTYTKSDVVFAA